MLCYPLVFLILGAHLVSGVLAFLYSEVFLLLALQRFFHLGFDVPGVLGIAHILSSWVLVSSGVLVLAYRAFLCSSGSTSV